VLVKLLCGNSNYPSSEGTFLISTRKTQINSSVESGLVLRLSYAEEKVEQYGGLSRMVNRNDDTVSAVFVAGQAVFLDGQPTEVLGTQRTGSFLRANTPASTGTRAEPVAAV
jgi:hypothetical protein